MVEMLEKYAKVCKTELLQYLNIKLLILMILQMKMISYIPDHQYKILITGGSESGKINALLYLIQYQSDIDKIHLYVKDPSEAKYQFLVNKCEKVGLDHFNDPNAFIEYSNYMQDVHKDIEVYNPRKKKVKY